MVVGPPCRGFTLVAVLKMNLSSLNCKLCDMFAKIARQTVSQPVRQSVRQPNRQSTEIRETQSPTNTSTLPFRSIPSLIDLHRRFFFFVVVLFKLTFLFRTSCYCYFAFAFLPSCNNYVSHIYRCDRWDTTDAVHLELKLGC